MVDLRDDIIGSIFAPGIMTGRPRTDALDAIVQREKDHAASPHEVRAGIELAKADSELQTIHTALHMIRHHAEMILRWRKLYTDGELSADGAMEQIAIESQAILGNT